MENAQTMGAAYQCILPTDSTNDLIKFVKESRNTNGGDGDEFYELVIKKIVEEIPWREGSTRSVLLIADAEPHECGYSYAPYVENNQIDWREEAMKAAAKGIKFDTVTIVSLPWFKELSMMTDGVSVPFKTGHKTGNLVRASVWSRGSMEARMKLDKLEEECNDEEIKDVLFAYKATRNKF